MFTDVVESTALFGSLGDEAAHALLATHFELMSTIAAEHGGRTVKNLGDGLMMVFEDAVLAARAAVRMQEAVVVEGQLHPPGLGLRIGVGSGEAVEDEGDFFGGPVIVAKRLCDRSGAGQILATLELADLVGTQDELGFASTGSLVLKGIADPVPSCEVIAGGHVALGVGAPPAESPAPEAFPLPPALRAGRDAFVGRDAELAFLADRFARVDSGASQLVLVAGQPGVGKSRLVAEFARREHDAGCVVLFGRCDDDALRSFQAFSEALELLAEGVGVMGRPLPDDWGRELARVAPALATKADQPSGEVERQAVFDQVQALFAKAANGGRLLLIIDDLHLADHSTLALLRHLCRSPRSALMIVATYRSDEVEHRPLGRTLVDLHRLELVQTLDVGDLDEREATNLVAAWAGVRPTREVSDALWRLTKGNPLYTRELLRYLLASDEIVVDRDELKARGSLQSARLPETVRAVLGVRLARLSEPCVQLLGAASTLGDEFSLEELRVLAEVEGDEDARAVSTFMLIQEASASGVVVPSRGANGVFRFEHGLTRQALHGDLTADRRATLHLRLAHYFESLLERGSDVLTDVAYHYAEAVPLSDASDVMRWSERAGEAAMQRLAYEDAAVCFERALSVLRPGRVSDHDRIRLLRRSGHSQITAGSVDAGRERLREAARIAERLGLREEFADIVLSFAGDGIGIALFEVGIVDGEIVSLIEQGLALLPPEDSKVRAKLLCHLAVASLFSADPVRRRRLADEATAMARRVGDQATLSYVLSFSCWASWVVGEARQRLELVDEAVELAQRVPDRMSEALAELVRFSCFVELGQRELAARSRARLVALAEAAQDPYQRLYLHMLEGTEALLEGRLAKAEQLASGLLTAAPERWAEIGFEQPSAGVVSCYAAQLAAIRMAQGRMSELSPAIEQFARDLPAVPVWRCVAVLAQMLADDPKGPARLRALALEEFRAMPRDMFFGTAAIAAAAACHLAMDPVSAAIVHAEIKHLHGLFHTHIGVIEFGAYDRALGELEIVLGHYDEAITLLESAQAAHLAIQAEFPLYIGQAQLAHALALRRRPGDAERAEQLLAELEVATRREGHGYARRIADRAAEALRGDPEPPVSTTKRVLASGRRGALLSRDAAKQAFTRTGQLTLRSLLNVAAPEQVERRLAQPSGQRMLFTVLARSFRPERSHGFAGTLGYSLLFSDGSAVGPADWHIAIAGRRAEARPGRAASPAVLVTIKAIDFLHLMVGDLGSIEALMDGRAYIEGDFEVASRMVDMFGGVPQR